VDEPNGTVIVIEDDAHISDLVAAYLRRDGFRVLQRPDGLAGVDSALAEPTRLVIVDVGLPGRSTGSRCAAAYAARVPCPSSC